MKINKYLLYGLVGLVSLVLIVFINGHYSSASPPDEETLSEIRQSINITEETQEYISLAHYNINNTVCWGGWRFLKEDTGWELIGRDEIPEAVKNVKSVLNQAQNEKLKADLEKTLYLIDKGMKLRDVGSLIDAHRILHDLDRFVFNPESGYEYYGVTKTLNN